MSSSRSARVKVTATAAWVDTRSPVDSANPKWGYQIVSYLCLVLCRYLTSNKKSADCRFLFFFNMLRVPLYSVKTYCCHCLLHAAPTQSTCASPVSAVASTLGGLHSLRFKSQWDLRGQGIACKCQCHYKSMVEAKDSSHDPEVGSKIAVLCWFHEGVAEDHFTPLCSHCMLCLSGSWSLCYKGCMRPADASRLGVTATISNKNSQFCWLLV